MTTKQMLPMNIVKRGIRVIDSCTNFDQLSTAITYIDLLVKHIDMTYGQTILKKSFTLVLHMREQQLRFDKRVE